MKTKLLFFVAPVLVAVGVLTALMWTRPPIESAGRTREAAPSLPAAPLAASAPVSREVATPEPTVAPAESTPPPSPATRPRAGTSAPNPGPPPPEDRRDPVAREAMALIGVDPEADAYWLDAIQDTSLSDSEREDLIEDLNENGYSAGNGSRATVQDLPIIEYRIAILLDLKRFGPYGDIRDPAIDEALKDLNNMHDDLAQR